MSVPTPMQAAARLLAPVLAWPSRPTIERAIVWPGHDRHGVRPDLVVLHETVTHSRARMVEVLRSRRLSTHFSITPSGRIVQHAPLARACWHAGPVANVHSWGVDLVNIVYPEWSRDAEADVLPHVPWVHAGPDGARNYVFPPEAQLESTWWLTWWLCRRSPEAPLAFPGVIDGAFHWGRVEGASASAGVAAHAHWAHSDGLVPTCYCALRARGMGPQAAHKLTRSLAVSPRRTTPLPSEAA